MGQYDEFAVEYDQAVRRRSPVIELAYEFVLKQLGPVPGKKVCDLGCGQGELSRRMAGLGAHVTGVDVSGELLNIANSYSPAQSIAWIVDDAQTLGSISSEQFDIVIANLMLMDVPRCDRVFRSACRILVPAGRMLWTITHPCFQSPHSESVRNEQGLALHRLIKSYEAQHWKSDGKGTLRGTLGAYHRPLSDYMNGFIEAGFYLEHMSEPTVPPDFGLEDNQLVHNRIPPVLGVTGVKKQ